MGFCFGYPQLVNQIFLLSTWFSNEFLLKQMRAPEPFFGPQTIFVANFKGFFLSIAIVSVQSALPLCEVCPAAYNLGPRPRPSARVGFRVVPRIFRFVPGRSSHGLTRRPHCCGPSSYQQPLGSIFPSWLYFTTDPILIPNTDSNAIFKFQSSNIFFCSIIIPNSNSNSFTV